MRRDLDRLIADAYAKMRRASETRRALPPGSSRARVTTANARWARACEHYDRLCAERDAASGLPKIDPRERWIADSYARSQGAPTIQVCAELTVNEGGIPWAIIRTIRGSRLWDCNRTFFETHFRKADTT